MSSSLVPVLDFNDTQWVILIAELCYIIFSLSILLMLWNAFDNVVGLLILHYAEAAVVGSPLFYNR